MNELKEKKDLILYDEQEVALIESIVSKIKSTSLHNAIAIVASAIEVYADEIEEENQESTFTEKYKDVALILRALEVVSGVADDLEGNLNRDHAKTRRVMRYRARSELLLGMADIQVIR